MSVCQGVWVLVDQSARQWSYVHTDFYLIRVVGASQYVMNVNIDGVLYYQCVY